jgi:drug/metabolite transporter (DMT)-like permease
MTAVLWVLLGYAMNFDTKVFWLMGLATFFLSITWFLGFRAFNRLPASLVAAVWSMYALIPLFWRTVVDRIGLSPVKWFGVSLILVALMLLSIEVKEIKRLRQIKLFKGIGLAAPLPLCGGIGLMLTNVAVAQTGWQRAYWYQVVWCVPMMLVLLLVTGKLSKLRLPRIKSPFLVNAASGMLAFWAVSWSLAKGEVAIIGVISSLSPLITLLLAHFWIRERLKKNQYAGIGLSLLGLVLLGL